MKKILSLVAAATLLFAAGCDFEAPDAAAANQLRAPGAAPARGGVPDDSIKPAARGGVPDDTIKPVARGGIPDDTIKPVARVGTSDDTIKPKPGLPIVPTKPIAPANPNARAGTADDGVRPAGAAITPPPAVKPR